VKTRPGQELNRSAMSVAISHHHLSDSTNSWEHMIRLSTGSDVYLNEQ
jgi:hypothetical protein